MADRRNLTDTFLKNLKPAAPGKRYAVSDSQCPGLKVRVTDTGGASFVLWRRFGGAANPSARLIGRVGEIALTDARDKAREWIALAKQGKDPAQIEADRQAEESRRKAMEAARADGTFGRAMEKYFDHIAHQRRADGVRADIERDLLPFWRDKLVTEISRKDVKERVQAVAKRTTYQAHAALSNARTFFNWARDALDLGLEAVPTDGMRAKNVIGKEKKSRKRILSDDELFAFWCTVDELPYPLGPGSKVLLLTGARLNEIMEADRRELNPKGTVLVVPEERFKSDAQHFVQLSVQAADIIAQIPRWNAGTFIFSRDGVKPARFWSKDRERLREGMLRILRELSRARGEDPERVVLPPFVLHDLRRTVRSRLSQLKVTDTVAEMVVGHARKGIQRVYDQYEYQDEMREALEKWAQHLMSLVRDRTDLLSCKKAA